MRVHSFLPCSEVNGPGKRFVLWVQGCTLGCVGCWNGETHPEAGGSLVGKWGILAQVDDARESYGIDGVTITGGEPLQQLGELRSLMYGLRRRDLDIGLFTGYTLEEVEAWPEACEVFGMVNWAVMGRYDITRRCERGLIASENQVLKIWNQGKYGRKDFQLHGRSWEVHVELAQGGLVQVKETGFRGVKG